MAGLRVPRNAAAPWRHLDFSLIAATVALASLGIVMIYSATNHKLEQSGIDPYFYVKKQATWIALGAVLMAVVATIDYRRLREFAPVLYGGAVLVLAAVISPVGSNAKGAQAWFQLGPFKFEPSEWAKVVLILCVASYGASHRGELSGRQVLGVLVLAAVPMALIELQPDLGTNLVFMAILMAVLLVAGARPRHIATLTVLGIVGSVAVLQLGVLKQYQVDRLTAFLHPTGDVRGSTYNLHQSVNAIAAGSLTGKGLFKGTQTNLGFVPEQHTDFIFTVVGEELGFAGAITLLALFAIVVWRTWRTAGLARDLFGTLLCVGVLAMFVFQVFENVGMTMGIMPITGIPLPFMSYGGSATIACFVGVGLVLNVHMRRFA
ncbi:MAG: rod shape-determining protein RodA [Acidimicrobiales bacterium]|jgi:rod shape determining protein RodA|nr:rod shape-determining protein RodA [Acidimicrobiales bacterium]